MTQLAIKGHETRGKEVIALLEMMGGKNYNNHSGIRTALYFIHNNTGEILVDFNCYDSNYTVFTLEEFSTKYPFKVGDRVIAYAEGCLAQFTIQGIRWNSELNKVEYRICSSWYDTSLIQPYKEETMETDVNDNKTLLNMSAIDYNNGLVGYEIPAGYEFDTVIDNKVVLKKLKSQYPKTYEECCKILGCKANHFFTDFSYNGLDIEISDYEDKIDDLLKNFRKLRYCRDAYWKIVGEQMGLGKPREPDWRKADERKYCIVNTEGNIAKWIQKTTNKILAFPTEEIRDAFYENFKELIEKCKELL